jgi:SPX domain protein involved in polyphosphate accumulation
MVQVNAKAVQHSYEATIRSLSADLTNYQQAAHSWFVSERQRVAVDIENALLKLDSLAKFAELNREGFRKILKKFDRRTGCGASPAAMADLRRLGFFLDAGALGAGRCAALRIALRSLIIALHVQGRC